MATGNATSGEFDAVWPPPEGVIANPENPDTAMQTETFVVAIVFPCFALAFTSMRLYTAKVIIGRLHWDDFFIVLSVFFSVVFSILQGIQTKNGLGIHIWEVSNEQYGRFNKVGIVAGPCYFLGILFVKISILLFYLRFPSSRAFKFAVYMILFVSVGYSLAGGVFGWTYMCRPLSYMWTLTGEGHCLNVALWFLTIAILNCVTDIAILVLPIWLLRPLRVPLAQKIALCGILMAGGFVFGISLFRIIDIPATPTNHDLTYRGAINIRWCIIELGVAIICACLPCLKALMTPLLPRLFDKLTPRNRLTLATIPTSDPGLGDPTTGQLQQLSSKTSSMPRLSTEKAMTGMSISSASDVSSPGRTDLDERR